MYSDLPLWAYLLIVLVITHITIASVTIFLHRCQAHRALTLHPLVSHFFRFWLWLTTGMVTREWVAIHRKHHARVDQSEDPHSPQVEGIAKVLWQGTELYRAEAKNQATLRDYGHGTADDWLERCLYGNARGSAIGVALMLVIDVVLFGAIGLTIWAIQMFWIPFFAAGVVNGVGHWWGYRNFEAPDASTNIVPFGFLIGGEELHNNHHAFASSARFSSKWYEMDIGWCYIRGLQYLRLARVRKLAPMVFVNRGKQGVDLDTLKAVVNNRLYVLSHYARDVVSEVYREERGKANRATRRLLRRGRRLLHRHESLLDGNARQRLCTMLEEHRSLRVVYEFKQRLQAIWSQRNATQDHLLQQLQEWCRQAEQTGVQALAEFARTMRGYTLQPA